MRGEVVVEHDRLRLAVQHRRNARVGLLRRQPLHQRLGLPQELLVGRGVGAALLDQVVEQLRHLLVEPRVGELVADDGLADVVDDPFGDGVPRELALLVELPGDGVVDAGLDDQLGQRQRRPGRPGRPPGRPGCRC